MDIKSKRKNVRIGVFCLSLLVLAVALYIASQTCLIGNDSDKLTYLLFLTVGIFFLIPYFFISYCIGWVIARLIYREHKTLSEK